MVKVVGKREDFTGVEKNNINKNFNEIDKKIENGDLSEKDVKSNIVKIFNQISNDNNKENGEIKTR